MPSVSRRELKQSLKKKGYIKKREGANYEFYSYAHEDLKSGIYTTVPRGSRHRELGDGFVAKVRRQLKLDRNSFLDFVKCPMTAEGYADELRAKELLLPKPKPAQPAEPQVLDLKEEEEAAIRQRLRGLMEDGCQDHRLWPLFGKLDEGTLTDEDLGILEELETQHAKP